MLLIEYGSLAIDDSFMPPFNSPAPRFLYNLTSVPQPNANNRTFAVANGCAVGGGSAVNGQLFDRGSKHDYDNWAAFPGNKGWDWNGLFPYFKKSVTFNKPTKEMQEFGITYDMAAWGGTTPIYASYPAYQYPAQKVLWAAWAAKDGVKVQKEHADGHAYGLFWIPISMDPASAYNRSFAGIGHWLRVPPRKNYHLLTEHRVLKINFKEKSGLQEAISVNIKERFGAGKTFTIEAKREIILSAAATRTPVLLQLSGIGPKKVLEEAKVKTLVDLPGVGWNLQDHSFSVSTYNFTKDLWPTTTTITTNATFRAEALAQYKMNNTGPYTAYVVSSGLFLPASSFIGPSFTDLVSELAAQDPAAYLPPDLPKQLIAGYAFQKKVLLASFQSNTSAILEHLFQASPRATMILLKPFSRGRITLNASDPLGDPVFDYRVLSNPIDLKLHVRMQQYARQHFATSRILAQLGPVELDPGASLPSDKDVAEWLVAGNKLFASNGHSVGTAAMMPRELGGVVDAGLRVYGTNKLSVADLSIVPLIPGTHTQSTAYAVGEKVSRAVGKGLGNADQVLGCGFD